MKRVLMFHVLKVLKLRVVECSNFRNSDAAVSYYSLMFLIGALHIQLCLMLSIMCMTRKTYCRSFQVFLGTALLA